MDENSKDMNTRAILITIEQSINNAIKAYIFEPNDSGTWIDVKSMISNYLTSIWKEGMLAGTEPEDAFAVDIGLGATMSPTDILEGIMRINVQVALNRPADFITITFQQQQQKP